MTPRRKFVAAAALFVLGALAGAAVVALVTLVRVSSPSGVPGLVDVARQVAVQVASVVPTPRPDPMALCRLDPAALADLPPRPNGRIGTTLHTCGAHIVNQNGDIVQITGVSWFGMETGTYAPHGLWTRNWKGILDQIVALGFNTIRIPFSDEALTPGRQPQSVNYDVNPDLKGLSSQEILDTLIQAAADRGLKIILDRHRPNAQAQSELWYTDTASEQRWIDNWVTLARRYN